MKLSRSQSEQILDSEESRSSRLPVGRTSNAESLGDLSRKCRGTLPIGADEMQTYQVPRQGSRIAARRVRRSRPGNPRRTGCVSQSPHATVLRMDGQEWM